MPELPEVETVRRTLLPHLVGKTIKTVEVLHPKPIRQSPDMAEQLTGKTISGIERRAKLLMISFADWDWTLCVHLKMTGQLFFQSSEALEGGGHSMSKGDEALPNKHTRAIFTFTDGSKLYFNDMRLFGYLRLADRPTLDRMLAAYGIEPGLPEFTQEAFDRIMRKRKTSTKAVLLNQELIAGLGNIYADEVCFASSVRPSRRVSSLTRKEKEALYQNCKKIIARAIKLRGTTFRSFNDANGKTGDFRNHLQVFDRPGEPCLRCEQGVIKKIQCAGRGTHYCPRCQR